MIAELVTLKMNLSVLYGSYMGAKTPVSMTGITGSFFLRGAIFCFNNQDC